MEVLKNCRVYPLSNYCSAEEHLFELPREIGAQGSGFRHVHLVEHSFRLTEAKTKLVEANIDSGAGLVVVIDVISCWKKRLGGRANVCYLNSGSTCHMEGLINFLSQLVENPLEALRRCNCKATFTQASIQGIVIDNLSYTQTPGSLRDFNILFKLLRTLRTTYGCWSLTTSYGLEYYNGIESLTSAAYTTGTTYTKIPHSYIKEMDSVIMRDTPGTMHTLK
ncbi:Platinum sensitivity protein 3 [Nakaseomyces bracarensis]|uniref:Platinum sensitivity protein 3 n=1 Tax=Nakaseomyces bracarensis TaxID=273131 RepID=A0ABR4NX87_9SACH